MNIPRKLVSCAGILLGALIVSAPAGAGFDRWHSHGPFGGTIHALAAAPSNPGVLYAATDGAGVYRSTDRGHNWRASNVGLSERRVHDLAVHPWNEQILYAATPRGVFRSIDGSRSWTRISEGLPALPVVRLAIDPADPDVLYAGLAGRLDDGPVLMKSSDGGITWRPSSEGLPRWTYHAGVTVLEIEIDASNPATLYATVFWLDDSSLFKSVDGGASWQEVLRGSIASVAVDPADSDRVYAGSDSGRRRYGYSGARVYRSLDGGASWTRTSPELKGVLSLAVDPRNPRTVYAGARDGQLFRSTDGGETWELANGAQLGASDVLALAIDEAEPRRLYAATAGAGVFLSADRGAHWQPRSHGLRNVRAVALAVDPTDPETVYVGTLGAGVFKSTDGGRSWEVHRSGLADADVHSLLIVRDDPATVYAATDDDIYLSTDGGRRWRPQDYRSRYPALTLVSDPERPEILYAGTQVHGVFRSTDRGRHWEWLGMNWVNARALAVDPSIAGTLYLGIHKGVMESRDRGAWWSWRWLERRISDRRVIDLDVNPLTPGVLYAVVHGRGVFKSTDGGGQWSASEDNLKRERVRALTADPWRPGTLYAATLAAGVQVSSDGGASWSLLGDGLRSRPAFTVAVAPSDPRRLYAGTALGVFAIELERP